MSEQSKAYQQQEAEALIRRIMAVQAEEAKQCKTLPEILPELKIAMAGKVVEMRSKLGIPCHRLKTVGDASSQEELGELMREWWNNPWRHLFVDADVRRFADDAICTAKRLVKTNPSLSGPPKRSGCAVDDVAAMRRWCLRKAKKRTRRKAVKQKKKTQN